MDLLLGLAGLPPRIRPTLQSRPFAAALASARGRGQSFTFDILTQIGARRCAIPRQRGNIPSPSWVRLRTHDESGAEAVETMQLRPHEREGLTPCGLRGAGAIQALHAARRSRLTPAIFVADARLLVWSPITQPAPPRSGPTGWHTLDYANSASSRSTSAARLANAASTGCGDRRSTPACSSASSG